jgi:hypothetical protein
MNTTQGGYFFLMMLMYCLASLPFAYVYSFSPKSELIGFIMFFIINVIACFLDMILSFISVFSQAQATNATGITKTSSILNGLGWVVAVLFPSVNLKRALFNIRLKSNPDCVSSLNSLMFTSYSSTDSWMSVNNPGLGAQFIIFCAQMIFWWVMLVTIENKISINQGCRKCCKRDKDLEQIDDQSQTDSKGRIVSSTLSHWDNEDEPLPPIPKKWDDAVC